MILWPGYSYDKWRRLHQKLVHETSEYLTYYMQHPEKWIDIPAVPVGMGVFSPGFAERFWKHVLFERD